MSKNIHNRFVAYSDEKAVCMIFKLEFDQDKEPTHVQIMDKIYQEVAEELLGEPVSLEWAKIILASIGSARDTYFELANHTIFNIFEVLIAAQQGEKYDLERGIELCCEQNRGDIALVRKVEEYNKWLDSIKHDPDFSSNFNTDGIGLKGFSFLWYSDDEIYLNFNVNGSVQTDSEHGGQVADFIRDLFSSRIDIGIVTSPNTLSQMRVNTSMTLKVAKCFGMPVTKLNKEDD